MADPIGAIPVVLFAYARPAHLQRVLTCLRADRVPLIHAFADGARGAADGAAVAEVRAMLRAIDWCDVRLVERTENLGLGRNVLSGVADVAARHEAFIVWEDDLVSVPGTYGWMCAALRQYAAEANVMSVSAWTHPRVTPPDVGETPYLDARADCWVWGAWPRSWAGMERTACEKMQAVAAAGVAPDAYGADLPRMARDERRRNIWAVRWLYHHLEHGGLCVRPPWSMVEHIGFDATASNAEEAMQWANPPLRPVPPLPTTWPRPVEHPQCRVRWQEACPRIGLGSRAWRKLIRVGRTGLRQITPRPWRARLQGCFGWRWFRGEYRDWASARRASGGYDDGAIVQKVLSATLEVKAGRAAFERDGVTFVAPEPDQPLLAVLSEISRAGGGRLRVVDFGGSLGSSYWRHRLDLPTGENLRWAVVEQPTFVEAGRRYLADTPLEFFPDVAAALAAGPCDVLLCSCVLQYLPEPYRMLEEWSRLNVAYVLLNNLTLTDREQDRLRVQHVPPSIYPATYPVWFFSRRAFRARIDERYAIVKEFDAEAKWPVGWNMLQGKGMLLQRRRTP